MGSNEEAIAKLQAGFEADVVNSCVDEATLEMVQKGIYVPLDVSRLEHWDDLFPSMTALPGVQVDGQVYMLPVDAGTAGIVYDADVVTTPPTRGRTCSIRSGPAGPRSRTSRSPAR